MQHAFMMKFNQSKIWQFTTGIVWPFLVMAADSPTAAAPESVAGGDAGKALIRVNVTAQSYNFYHPWEKGQPGTRRGLGVLLENGQVLITARMVADATFVELERPMSGEKTIGQVAVVDYEANLALVKVAEDKPDFLVGLTPLSLDTSPVVEDELDVWQVKDNGLAVGTSCPLIEVSVANYFLEGTPFLTYEVRGSLQYHSGSFVLPVLHGEKLAGLLMSYDPGEQVSRVLAAPIIKHFLDDIEDGDYAGFPTLGLAFSRATDEQLRHYLKLERDSGGVYTSMVVPNGTADQAGIQVGDVLLEINGHPIDSRGNYEHPEYGKLNLSHLVRGDSQVGQEIPIVILRDGQRKELLAKMTRKSAEDYLIDPYLFDQGPRFYVAGGLVFQELTKPYLRIFGDQWRQRAPMKLLWALEHPEEYEKEGRKKLVFISRVLRTPVTLGYESVSHVIVDKVNGKEIKSLKDLAEAFQQPESAKHHIEISEAPHELFLHAGMTEAMNQRLREVFRMGELSRLE